MRIFRWLIATLPIAAILFTTGFLAATIGGQTVGMSLIVGAIVVAVPIALVGVVLGLIRLVDWADGDR